MNASVIDILITGLDTRSNLPIGSDTKYSIAWLVIAPGCLLLIALLAHTHHRTVGVGTVWWQRTIEAKRPPKEWPSEDDLRKEYGWSDRAWRLNKNHGPITMAFPDRRKYEKGKALIPAGYELSQVNIMTRHAARYPTFAAYARIIAALSKIERLPFETDVTLEEYIEEVKKWDPTKSEAMLTDVGRRTAHTFGKEYADRYKDFISRNPDAAKPFVRASGAARVVETAGYFLDGFDGNAFEFKDMKQLQKPEVIFDQFKKDVNNTLGPHRCEPFNAKNPHSAIPQLSTYTSTLLPLLPVLRDVVGQKPGEKLDAVDLVALMHLGGFEGAFLDRKFTESGACVDEDNMKDGEERVEKKKGWMGWEDVFKHLGEEAEEAIWQRYAYWFDVKKYYWKGQGNPLSRNVGLGYLTELIHRLTNAEKWVDVCDCGRRGNEDPKMFPLPEKGSGRGDGRGRMFVDFSHDNRMIAVLTAMRVLHRDTPLPLTYDAKSPRDYDQGKISPFSMTITVERWSRRRRWSERWRDWLLGPLPGLKAVDRADDLVRILLNDDPVFPQHPSTLRSPFAHLNLCTLAEFLDSQKWAMEGGEYGALVRGEVDFFTGTKGKNMDGRGGEQEPKSGKDLERDPETVLVERLSTT